jgi:serine/threonine protein kinase/Tfp pilus assembly protein PilF
MAANGSDNDQTRSFMAIAAGTRVSHYTIISKIGAGGMGEVYLAEDTQLDRQVALKFLPAHLSQDEAARARFTREAKAAAKLDHPNIVPVYEVGEFRGRPFFAMAHIEGKSLRNAIKEGKFSINDAIEFTGQICKGLHKAHESGVVHRDVKPGNIIIDQDNKVRILDFGLATVAGEDKLTRTGSTLGTVGYMSPEQIEGKQVDQRSDLFSVGVILYEMLTGRRPFEGDTDAAVSHSITHSNPEPIARYKSGTTGELQSIIDKALSKDPTLRYQHADGMLADLKRLHISPPVMKSRRLTYWIAAFFIIIIGGYAGYSRFLTEKPQPAEPKRLVVLPFDNLGDSSQAYFASGLSDEIISRLSRIGDLSVVSRLSAARLKQAGVDLKKIGDSLGAEFVLDASAQYQIDANGNRHVRLTTQLINVKEDRVMWSQTYDTVSTELFNLQSEMALRVADELGIVLSPHEQKAVWARYTDSEEAYDYYLRGSRYFYQGVYGIKKYLRLAIDMCEEAVKIDSGFSRPHATMAKCYSRLWSYYVDRTDSVEAKAKYHVDRAFELATREFDSASAHFARASYLYRVRREYDKSLREYEIAFKDFGGRDNYLYLWNAFPILRDVGQWDEAYDCVKRACELEPLEPNLKYDLATVCEFTRRYTEAEDNYLKTIRMRPDWVNGYARLADMYINWLGDTQKARDIIDRGWDKVDTTALVNRLANYDIIDGRPDDALARTPQSDHFQWKAWINWVAGNIDSARFYYDSIRVLWEANARKYPHNPLVWEVLGRLHGRLGQKAKALEYAQKAINMRPLATNAMRATNSMMELFNVYVYLGALDTALVRAEELLSMPSELSFGLLMTDPDYKDLIRHPGFAHLVEEFGDEYQKRLYRERVGSPKDQ